MYDDLAYYYALGVPAPRSSLLVVSPRLCSARIPPGMPRDLRARRAPPLGQRVLAVSWARVIRGRLPAIGRPNAEILHHGPPPAYARGQAAVGGAEPWPQVHPGILRGVRAAAGL